MPIRESAGGVSVEGPEPEMIHVSAYDFAQAFRRRFARLLRDNPQDSNLFGRANLTLMGMAAERFVQRMSLSRRVVAEDIGFKDSPEARALDFADFASPAVLGLDPSPNLEQLFTDTAVAAAEAAFIEVKRTAPTRGGGGKVSR